MSHAIAPVDDIGLSPGKKRPWFLPLNHPPVVRASEASHMRAEDLVVGVVAQGKARAYPWWILANYHIANDSLQMSDEPAGFLWSKELGNDGNPGYAWYPHLPLLVTLCEASAGAAAFVPVFDDAPEHPLVFSLCEPGAAGSYAAVGTFTLCDLQTHSRWHSLTGKAGSGPLAGRQLARVPAFVDRWDAWARDYPATDVVIAGAEMRQRPHVRDLPAIDDPQAAHTTLRVARLRTPEKIDHRLEATELVLGVAVDGGPALACPLAWLRRAGGVAQRDLAGEPCLLVLDGTHRGIAFSRRLGGEVLELQRRSQEGPLRLQDESGSLWNAVGEAVSGPRLGQRLPLFADSYVSKWSEWSLGHPSATIVGQ
jgi:hypothetical protein